MSNIGVISSVTDANGYTTSYGYDAMGRLDNIIRPSGDTVAWNVTTLNFAQINAAEYDLPAGHWRQTVSTGNARRITYFDALWRPVLTKTFDAGNPTGTGHDVLRRFDADGRAVYESYPTRGVTSVNANPAGSTTTYDALGRATQTVQSSELGNLSSTTAYLGGFQKQVSNARGHVTRFTAFQAFDQPSEDALLGLVAPEGVNLAIARDVFGKPTAITRSGNWGGSPVSATRRYVYDTHQRLCKTTEPEAGATLQDYDTANNLAWRASGSPLTGLSCDRDSVPAAGKTSFGYDARNRLTSTTYGDGGDGITRGYTPDGLVQSISSDARTWTYSYNRRRLMTRERFDFEGSVYNIDRGYDANASPSQLTYPDGTAVAYNPNALGQPTTVGGYAHSITHHPNGAVAGYTLGNGIVHTLTQNTRGLPLVNRDAGVMQDSYSFDANANVTAIADQQESVTSRSMGYDALDRLTAANAPNVWGNASYTYDPLDNLRTSVVGSRSTTHGYDASNRLNLLTTNGSSPIGLAYDARGNVTGRGSQGYYFDQANRLKLALDKAAYAYDGWGRRATVSASTGVYRTQLYGRSGALLYGRTRQGMSSWDTRYVHLGAKLIAETTNGNTQYAHTDALGSPVARTNPAGGLISRTRYEAYGATASGTNPGANGFTGIGFTGHVNDPDTALVYMQQRYYDPVAGRFLSVDLVTTDANSGGGFNRYVYGNNNPYKYTDPDGEFAFLASRPIAIGAVAIVGGLAQGITSAIVSPEGSKLSGFGSVFISGAVSGAASAATALSGASIAKAGLEVANNAKGVLGVVAGATAQIASNGINAGTAVSDVGDAIKPNSGSGAQTGSPQSDAAPAAALSTTRAETTDAPKPPPDKLN